MLQITEEQVQEILTMEKAIGLVDLSFRQLAEGTAINHPRRRLVLPGGSILHYMAAGNPDYFGIKVYSTNPRTGAHFQFLLYRCSDGLQLANIQANRMGQIRTGAASGVATNYLAHRDAGVMGIIGSGFQAETQIAAISKIRNLREIRVWSRDASRRKEFAGRCAAKFNLNIQPTSSAQTAIEGADIVVTATNSKGPVLESAWILPGAHINAIGSNWINRRELPTDLIQDRSALVTVDSIEDARLESGDLMIPMNERPERNFPVVELSEIVAGKAPGRTSTHQITIFKSNGLAAQDLAVGAFMYEALASYS